MRALPVLLTVCTLAGCGVPSMVQGLKVTPVGIAARPVGETADCIYVALEALRGSSPSMRKVEIASQGRAVIEYVPDGFLFWRYTLTADGPNKTRVSLESHKPVTEAGIPEFERVWFAPARGCGVI